MFEFKLLKVFVVTPVIVVMVMIIPSLLPNTSSAESIDVSTSLVPPVHPLTSEIYSSSLKVLTLNIAHGRGDSFNQMFLGKKSFEKNLKAISHLLRQSKADIVALQEVDKTSLWSGRFDHGKTLAAQAGFPWLAHAGHAKSWLFDFGTAVLSRLPIKTVRAERFAPSPPTLRKGFVVSQVHWVNPRNQRQKTLIDVVSVHLDFASEEVRANQIDEMIKVLSRSTNPMIVLGDFNSEWQIDQSPVQVLAKGLDLKVFNPNKNNLSTHQNTRIDWILLSPALVFKNYKVLPEIVSDHQAVVAEVEFTDKYLSSLQSKENDLSNNPVVSNVVSFNEKISQSK